jgi:SAM-dependent methyltransferase
MSIQSNSLQPAEIYDQAFVPALFAPWGPVMADLAIMKQGDRVLDVACGTGALTLAVAERVGPQGSVVGLDASPDMLTVARRSPHQIEWIEGFAEALPFTDGSFDRVVSQFGLMFFKDPTQALREMTRVLRPGGTLAVAVCDAVDRSPGYDALAKMLDRLFGTTVGDAFRAPFSLGDSHLLHSLAEGAGMNNAAVDRHMGTVRFPSIAALVATERACVWTLGGLLTDDQFDRLQEAAQSDLQAFTTPDGQVVFDMPALVLTARKPKDRLS